MHRVRLFLAASLVMSVSLGLARAADKNNYRVTILVSNEAGEAPVIDPCS